MSTSTQTLFTVTGGFEIAENLTPLVAFSGETVGYVLPDGRVARLVVALEIEDRKKKNPEDAFTYITSEQAMADLGFEALDYGVTEFETEDEPATSGQA